MVVQKDGIINVDIPIIKVKGMELGNVQSSILEL